MEVERKGLGEEKKEGGRRASGRMMDVRTSHSNYVTQIIEGF